MVYRLVSKFTVEEKIVENATKKNDVGEIIMNPLDQSKADKGIIESILMIWDKGTFEQNVRRTGCRWNNWGKAWGAFKNEIQKRSESLRNIMKNRPGGL